MCLQLRKVRRNSVSLLALVFFMLTDFPVPCLQLVAAHFKQGERTWSAENILEGEYHFAAQGTQFERDDLRVTLHSSSGFAWKTCSLTSQTDHPYQSYRNTQAMTVALLVFSLSYLNPWLP